MVSGPSLQAAGLNILETIMIGPYKMKHSNGECWVTRVNDYGERICVHNRLRPRAQSKHTHMQTHKRLV